MIGIIYESRPNVTSDAAALALKSGSAVVLRSGKDAYQTAPAIVTALKNGWLRRRFRRIVSSWFLIPVGLPPRLR